MSTIMVKWMGKMRWERESRIVYIVVCIQNANNDYPIKTNDTWMKKIKTYKNERNSGGDRATTVTTSNYGLQFKALKQNMTMCLTERGADENSSGTQCCMEIAMFYAHLEKKTWFDVKAYYFLLCAWHCRRFAIMRKMLFWFYNIIVFTVLFASTQSVERIYSVTALIGI